MTTGLTLRDAPSISADSALTVERSRYTGTSAAVTVASEVSLQTPRDYVVCKVIKCCLALLLRCMAPNFVKAKCWSSGR